METLNRNLEIEMSPDDMSTAFLTPIFFDTGFQEFFNVDTNARHKKRIPFLDFNQNLLRPVDGCSLEEVQAVKMSNRTFDVDSTGFRMGLCADEFENTVIRASNNTGVAVKDLQGSQIMEAVLEAAKIGIRKDLNNCAYFGKKDMAPVAGAEYLQNANGLWSYYLPKINAEGKLKFTAANTALTGANAATDLIRTVVNNAANVLKALPASQKVILVDSVTYESYYKDKEDTESNGGFTTTLDSGKEALTFRSIPVVPMYEFIDVLTSLGIDTAALPPNFVLYMATGNLWFGTDSSDAENELSSYYEKKDRKNYVDCEFKVGFNYFHEEFFSVAANETVLTTLQNL